MDRKTEINDDLVAKVAEHLKTIYSLEPEQVEQMIRLSSRSIAEALELAGQTLADSDLSALSGVGHKVKGILLGIGLNEDADLAREIEMHGKAGKDTDYSRMIEQLKENLRPLLLLPSGDIQS